MKGEENRMKKKTRIVALLLVCVLMVGMTVSFASAVEMRMAVYGTITDNCNLRSKPSLSASIGGILLSGTTVQILSEVSGDGILWYYVLVKNGDNANLRGYVSAGCVSKN